MEDLWKLTRIDYRISTIAEQSAYEEIMRRYHAEEAGSEKTPLQIKADHLGKTKKE